MTPLISVVIVTHDSAGEIGRCLESLARSGSAAQTEVIVVDNMSTDETRAIVERGHPWAKLVASDDNLGYAGGNRLGASKATGRYLLLLNPDTVVSPDAIGLLADTLSRDRATWVAGPCILDREGRPGHSWGDLPTLAWAFIDRGPGRWLGLRTRTEVARIGECEAERDVGFVTGASMMTTAEAWARLDGLDDAYFLYFEDVDYCFRAHREGGKVRVVPAARVSHIEGASFGADGGMRTLKSLQGLVLYLARNRSGAAAWLYQASVWFEHRAYVLVSYVPARRFAGIRRNRAAHREIARGLAVRGLRRRAPRGA